MLLCHEVQCEFQCLVSSCWLRCGSFEVLASQPLGTVTFSDKFKCIACLIVSLVCLLHELHVLRELS